MFSSDEEALDAVKRWWKENGGFVIAGLVIGVALIGGWRFWEASQETRAREASALHQEFLSAAGSESVDRARERAGELREDYASTPYAAQANLRLASLLVSAGDAEAALEPLEWVVDNAPAREFEKLARLRLSRVHVATESHEDALAVLDAVDPGRFAALYEEARGDALMAAERPAQARQAYGRALELADGEFAVRAELEMKYNDLAGYDE